MNLALLLQVLSITVIGYGLYEATKQAREDYQSSKPPPAPSPATEPTTARVFPELDFSATIPVLGNDKPLSLDQLYQKHAAENGLDWRLLKAIAQKESGENPNAVGAAGEIGLMQVLCVKSPEGFCTVHFNVKDWGPPHYTDLFDPDYNLHIAAQVLAWNLAYAGGNVRDALAVYNGGIDPPGSSYSYAADVLAKYTRLGGVVTGTVTV